MAILMIASVSFGSTFEAPIEIKPKPKRGYNYKAHAKRGNKMYHKTQRRNKGRDMLHHRCTNKH